VSFAEMAKGMHGGLIGARSAALISVSGKSLDAHEWDDVSASGHATGNV